MIDKVGAAMDGVEDELLADLDAGDRAELERLLLSVWERAGGYEAYSKVPARGVGLAARRDCGGR